MTRRKLRVDTPLIRKETKGTKRMKFVLDEFVFSNGVCFQRSFVLRCVWSIASVEKKAA